MGSSDSRNTSSEWSIFGRSRTGVFAASNGDGHLGKMNNLGVGVIFNMAFGNKDTVDAIQGAIGKTISAVKVDPDMNNGDGILCFTFTDGTGLHIFDNGRSCCEARYMGTDDCLDEYIGARLLGFEVRDAPAVSEHGNEHEIQFLAVTTDKGMFTMDNHNEHNGYYGGFCMCAKAVG